MTVILAFADLIFAKNFQHRYAHNKCLLSRFNFREWYQNSRNSRNLNPTKIMPYTVSGGDGLGERSGGVCGDGLGEG